MDFVEEFTRDGKNFVYVDFSELESDESYMERIKLTMPAIEKHPENSLYMIANLDNVKFDSNTKKITADYIKSVKPYLRAAAIFGVDGIKKMMITTAMKTGGYVNTYFGFSKEQAIAWLLKQE